jgi:hypothetical protein
MRWPTWRGRKYATRPRTDLVRARPRFELLEDRTVPSTVWYVNASAIGAGMSPAAGISWANAFTDLQSALRVAQPGDQIWVAQGTYKPTTSTDRTASFALKDGVAVYGGFGGTETQLSQRDLMHHTTILSGDIGTAGDNSDNSYHVVTAVNVSAAAILDGFTITGGNAHGGADQGIGGGLFADNAKVTLAHLIFTGNSAYTGGGLEINGGAPTITNAVFSANNADAVGPAGFTPDNPPSAANGGALFNAGGSPILMNVTVTGNIGGGIDSSFHSSVTVTNSIVWGNTDGEIGDAANVTYSDVQRGEIGTGNINADPQFVDAAHGNLRLQPTSPAIDVGTNTGAPSTDLDGRPRPGIVRQNADMGAYEYQLLMVGDLRSDYFAANYSPIVFHLFFNVPVTDFTAADVVVYGSAGATTARVTGSGTLYDIAVSGMKQDGEVNVRIPANVVHDAAGDGNMPWQQDGNFVTYDTTPPVSTATLSGTLGNGGWYTGPVQVTLSATDTGSGVRDIGYLIDGIAPPAVRGGPPPFTVTGDGTHTVTFASGDYAGNGEATQTITFKIDTTPPTTAFQLWGADGHGGHYSSDVRVVLLPTDATSGVAATYYRVDDGTLTPYHGDFMVRGLGQHHVTFYSVDNAGNVERAQTVWFNIYALPPKLWLNPPAPVNLATNLQLPLAGVTGSGATGAVTVTDGSGHSVAATTAAAASGEWSIPALDVHNLADGTLTIHATATDTAGAQTTQVRSTTKSSRLVLTFSQEPGSTLVGHALFAVVQLRDGFGHALDLPGQTVTVSLPPVTPTGTALMGTLHGTLTVHTDGEGRAIFRNLSITAPGLYRLQAADGTATVVSNFFHIGTPPPPPPHH